MSRVSTALIAVFVCFVFAAGASAQRRGGDPKARAVKNPVPATPASVTLGAACTKNCRQCHGLRLKGDGLLAPKNPRPADLTDDKWDHGSTDGEIFAVIWNGAPAPMTEMKPMKGTLTDEGRLEPRQLRSQHRAQDRQRCEVTPGEDFAWSVPCSRGRASCRPSRWRAEWAARARAERSRAGAAAIAARTDL